MFDLKDLLASHNGATEYFVHYCEEYSKDRYNAERLSGLPGVRLCPYPCDRHSVIQHLVKQGLLMDLLRPDTEETPGRA